MQQLRERGIYTVLSDGEEFVALAVSTAGMFSTNPQTGSSSIQWFVCIKVDSV